MPVLDSAHQEDSEKTPYMPKLMKFLLNLFKVKDKAHWESSFHGENKENILFQILGNRWTGRTICYLPARIWS